MIKIVIVIRVIRIGIGVVWSVGGGVDDVGYGYWFFLLV